MWGGLYHRLAHRPLMDRYFAAGVDPRHTQVVLDRLGHCLPCRVHYQRRLLFEQALPDGERLRNERLWAAIRGSAGMKARPPVAAASTSSRRRVWSTVGVAALAAVVLMVARSDRRPTGEAVGPAARGSGDSVTVEPTLHIFRSLDGARSEPVNATIHASDGLLMAYSNPSPDLKFLMVFAIDEQRHVHWYYPAYESAESDPAAIPVRPGALGVELGDEIRHPLEPGALRVFAVFLTEERRVRATEALLAPLIRARERPATELVDLPLAGAKVSSRLLQVIP